MLALHCNLDDLGADAKRRSPPSDVVAASRLVGQVPCCSKLECMQRKLNLTAILWAGSAHGRDIKMLSSGQELPISSNNSRARIDQPSMFWPGNLLVARPEFGLYRRQEFHSRTPHMLSSRCTLDGLSADTRKRAGEVSM